MGLYRRSDGRHKNKVWWISYMVGGRQHRESTGFTNKKMAEKLLVLRKAQVVEERWDIPRSSTPRLGTQVEDFLASITHEKTRSRYACAPFRGLATRNFKRRCSLQHHHRLSGDVALAVPCLLKKWQ